MDCSSWSPHLELNSSHTKQLASNPQCRSFVLVLLICDSASGSSSPDLSGLGLLLVLRYVVRGHNRCAQLEARPSSPSCIALMSAFAAPPL